MSTPFGYLFGIRPNLPIPCVFVGGVFLFLSMRHFARSFED